MGKYNLLVPLAGKGKRMEEGGYSVPKPIIPAGDRHILDWSMESIDYSECNLIFVILKEQAYNFSLDSILKQKYPGCQVVLVDKPTRGSVETCLAAKHLIANKAPLIIFCPDVYFQPKYVPQKHHFDYDGYLLTFKANSPNYSYVRQNDEGLVIETREKVIISQDAAVGVYCFQSGLSFIRYAEQMIADNIREQNEFFLCPLYNLLIQDGLRVGYDPIHTIYIMGTYQELQFFENDIFPYLYGPTEFVLCSDHSGYVAKEEFKRELLKRNRKVIDCGCFNDRDCDYQDFLHLAAMKVRQHPGAFGIGFCRTGQGMNIAANKEDGIRSALIIDAHFARKAIAHNATNFFSISSGYVASNIYDRIIDELILTRFEGGRHQNRLQKINAST